MNTHHSTGAPHETLESSRTNRSLCRHPVHPIVALQAHACSVKSWKVLSHNMGVFHEQLGSTRTIDHSAGIQSDTWYVIRRIGLKYLKFVAVMGFVPNPTLGGGVSLRL